MSLLVPLDVPEFCLVVLVGLPGAGKSRLAARCFRPEEIVPASAGLPDAVAAVEDRLRRRLLTVVDAANVLRDDRVVWLKLARQWHALPVAIICNPPASFCLANVAARADGVEAAAAIRRLAHTVRDAAPRLAREGLKRSISLATPSEMDALAVTTVPLPVDRRAETGPFDIVGDVHGCIDELVQLLGRLGHDVSRRGDGYAVRHPAGRRLVFVGDLVDRGPCTPEVLRLVMSACETAGALCVQGNHDRKLGRWLSGAQVEVAHGLQDSIAQLAGADESFLRRAGAFLLGLPSHLWLDGGRLVVTHAAMKEEMLGRDVEAVSDFTLYGNAAHVALAPGPSVRLPWVEAYAGTTTVVYRHSLLAVPGVRHNTIGIDTGCAYGGRLTALRWPERGTVSVRAQRAYSRLGWAMMPLYGSERPAEATTACA